MKLVRATIALAAFGALLVVPSIASASPEQTCPTGTKCPVGTLFEAKNIAHSTTPTQSVLSTSLGNATCGTATLTGTLTKNSGTEIQGEITTAEFGGTHEKTTAGHCQGTGAFGSQPVLTPNHTSDEDKSLPWCLTLNNAKDEFSVRGGKCGEPRPLTFVLHVDGGKCTYEAAEIKGNYTTHPADAIATINGAKAKKAGGSIFCPAEGTLSAALTIFIHGKPTEPLYIS